MDVTTKSQQPYHCDDESGAVNRAVDRNHSEILHFIATGHTQPIASIGGCNLSLVSC